MSQNKNQKKSDLGPLPNLHEQAPPSSLKKGFAAFFVVAILAVIGGVVYQHHSVGKERQEREEELAKGPKVKVAKAVASPTQRDLKIAGEARAFASVTLYAKISGYLKDIKVDKGDKVKKNQVLAVIESPETEQAYQAALSESKNRRAIAERTKSLLERTLVSQQEADQVFADAEVADARLKSAIAQKEYQTIRAPFDGTITSRFADPGALVQNATNAQTGALPLLSISQIDQLRVYVYIDQRDVPFVQTGTQAEVYLPERPETPIVGHLARISGQLDDKTRMLLAEIDLDNNNGQVVAGSLVNVVMHLKASPGVDVPSDALILQGLKTVVGIVDENNVVDYSEVKVVDNNGERAKLQSGVAPGQTVMLGAGNTIPPKSKVRPIVEDQKTGAGAPPQTQGAAPTPVANGNANSAPASTSSLAPAEGRK